MSDNAVVQTEYILNGAPQGEVTARMFSYGFDPGWYQPFIADQGPNQGKPCLTINTGRMIRDNKTGKNVVERRTYPVRYLVERGYDVPNQHLINNATTLTKQVWQELINRVVMATRTRLRAAADLETSSSRRVDAWSKATVEYQAMNDPGEAIITMDPVAPARRDRPQFVLSSVPIPFIYGDFDFTKREIGISQGMGGGGYDSKMVEALSRRCGEVLEGLTIGTVTGPTWGTVSGGPGTHRSASVVQGYTTFTYRLTKTDLTTPTGTNPEAVMTDVLEMVETMQTNGFYGPYVLYHSTSYSRYLGDDYFRSGSTSTATTLRRRILDIEGIADLRRLDNLTSGYQLILVQMDSETGEMVVGLPLTVLQWDTVGGLRKNFKIMMAKVPLFYAKYNGTAAILHATTS